MSKICLRGIGFSILDISKIGFYNVYKHIWNEKKHNFAELGKFDFDFSSRIFHWILTTVVLMTIKFVLKICFFFFDQIQFLLTMLS